MEWGNLDGMWGSGNSHYKFTVNLKVLNVENDIFKARVQAIEGNPGTVFLEVP